MKWNKIEKIREMSMNGMIHIQLRDLSTDAVAAFASFLNTTEPDVNTEEMIPVVYMYVISLFYH